MSTRRRRHAIYARKAARREAHKASLYAARKAYDSEAYERYMSGEPWEDDFCRCCAWEWNPVPEGEWGDEVEQYLKGLQ